MSLKLVLVVLLASLAIMGRGPCDREGSRWAIEIELESKLLFTFVQY